MLLLSLASLDSVSTLFYQCVAIGTLLPRYYCFNSVCYPCTVIVCVIGHSCYVTTDPNIHDMMAIDIHINTVVYPLIYTPDMYVYVTTYPTLDIVS